MENIIVRFSYVKYDEESARKQEELKKMFEAIDSYVHANLEDGRYRSLLLTALEEAYAWSGKSIRDSQIKRNVNTEHIAERSNA